MSSSEQLASYLSQLTQINELLEDDSDNSELLELKKDLEQLVELMKQQLGNDKTSITTTTTTDLAQQKDSDLVVDWKIGDLCEVKQTNWIKGEIVNISADLKKLTVKVGTGKQEQILFVTIEQLRRPVSTQTKIKYFGFTNESSSSSKKRNREKRIEKRVAFEAKKDAEQSEKKQSWQSFQSRISKSNAPNSSLFTNPHKNLYKKPESKK